MKCYRVSNRKFNIGDFFPLSNWGRFVQKSGNKAGVYYEKCMEEFRTEISPESVTRLKCLFAFKKIEDADSYASFNKGKNCHIYELEAKTGNYSIHNYDITSFMLKFIKNNDIDAIQSFHHLMRMYWLEFDDDIQYGYNIRYVPELLINKSPLVTKVIC